MKNSVRITGGDLKGKKIPFNFKSSLRPTSSKLREVLFNWIQFETDGIDCLDLFAGTGSLGIEAISRGANKTVFIESNKKNFQILKNTIRELKLNNKSIILFKDASTWIKENNLSSFDLIFLDPPFNENLEKKVLDILKKRQNLKSSCKIYVEFSKFTKVEIPDSLTISKEKTLGDVKALLLNNDN